jgi:hypothetical protein
MAKLPFQIAKLPFQIAKLPFQIAKLRLLPTFQKPVLYEPYCKD